MIQITDIIFCNGTKSDPIEVNRVIEKKRLDRFRHLVESFARIRNNKNMNVLLIYKDLKK